MYVKHLSLFTATTEKIYPNMSEMITLKSVHMTNFFVNDVSCSMAQGARIANLSKLFH
jgi:hypothetical protein